MKSWHHFAGQPPVEVNFQAILGLYGMEGQPTFSSHSIDDGEQPVADVGQRISLIFDEQGGFRLRWDQQIEVNGVLAGQAKMSPIHQIARARPKRQNLSHRSEERRVGKEW